MPFDCTSGYRCVARTCTVYANYNRTIHAQPVRGSTLVATRSRCTAHHPKTTQTWKIVARNPVHPLSWPCTLLYPEFAVFYNTSAHKFVKFFLFPPLPYLSFRSTRRAARWNRLIMKIVKAPPSSLCLSPSSLPPLSHSLYRFAKTWNFKFLFHRLFLLFSILWKPKDGQGET